MNNFIVPTNVAYSSYILSSNLNTLYRKFPFLDIKSVGVSNLGNPINVIKLGTGNKKVFYSASFHANEWITSVLLMKFIEDYCNAYVSKGKIYNYYITDLFNSCSIYIIPMVNPDGVNLVTGNINKTSQAYRNCINISNDFPDIPFPSGWKSNIRGIDLNLQFPAKWNQSKEIKYSQGFTKPAPKNFVGYGPLTEPESLAIYNFTLMHNFDLVICFHTQGQEIYWKFLNYTPPRSFEIGKKFANSSGYNLTLTPYISSFAGYKDWFIQEYNRPGYTIEAGIGQNPLSISQFDKIYNDIIGILILGATV